MAVGVDDQTAGARAYNIMLEIVNAVCVSKRHLGDELGNILAQHLFSVRLERQQRLTNGDRPNYWAVLNEAVIRRPVGGGEVMSSQLGHIAAIAELPNVTVQVLPFSAGVHPAMDGSYSILGFPDPYDSDVVYQENQSGSVYLEKAAEVERFSQMFSYLMAKALSPEDSVRLIREVATGL